MQPPPQTFWRRASGGGSTATNGRAAYYGRPAPGQVGPMALALPQEPRDAAGHRPPFMIRRQARTSSVLEGRARHFLGDAAAPSHPLMPQAALHPPGSANYESPRRWARVPCAAKPCKQSPFDVDESETKRTALWSVATRALPVAGRSQSPTVSELSPRCSRQDTCQSCCQSRTIAVGRVEVGAREILVLDVLHPVRPVLPASS